jgi:hypothetical protein
MRKPKTSAGGLTGPVRSEEATCGSLPQERRAHEGSYLPMCVGPVAPASATRLGAIYA